MYCVVIFILVWVISILFYRLDTLQLGRNTSSVGYFKFYLSKLNSCVGFFFPLFSKTKLRDKRKDKEQETWSHSDKRNEDNSRPKKSLIVQNTELRSEIESLKHSISTLKSEYGVLENVYLKSKQDNEQKIQELTSDNIKKSVLLDDYKNSFLKAFAVDEYEVAIKYCTEYKLIMTLLKEAFQRVVDEMHKGFEISPFIIDEDNVDYLVSQFFIFHNQNDINTWFILLDNVAAVPKNLSFDLDKRSTSEQQLHFLQKYTFEKSLRPTIASFVLFAEKIRNKLVSLGVQTNVGMIIEDFCNELLNKSGISVDFIQIGSVIRTDDFQKYEIELSDEGTETNTIINVIKYAVNVNSLNVDKEKTVIELKM